MLSKIKKLFKELLGIQPQPTSTPDLGVAEKRLQDLLALEQEMLERKCFLERQREAQQTAEVLLYSMKANGLLPHQIEKDELLFKKEEEEFSVKFRRILNGED